MKRCLFIGGPCQCAILSKRGCALFSVEQGRGQRRQGDCQDHADCAGDGADDLNADIAGGHELML